MVVKRKPVQLQETLKELTEFYTAAMKHIYASKRRNHYPLLVARLRIVARIRQINKEFVTAKNIKGLTQT